MTLINYANLLATKVEPATCSWTAFLPSVSLDGRLDSAGGSSFQLSGS